MDVLSSSSDGERPLRMTRQNADGHALDDDVPLRMTRRNADGDECTDTRLRMSRMNADAHLPELALMQHGVSLREYVLAEAQQRPRPHHGTEREGAASHSTTFSSNVSSAYRSTLLASDLSSPTRESTSDGSSDDFEWLIAV
mmetsp:Transcript_24791/g.45469  ORF Transcript_24791/g.45469 Transcript_24791/m.45469 type:complete len:142 (+) Transcript_24791:44-469(+)